MATPNHVDAEIHQDDSDMKWSEKPTSSITHPFPHGRDPVAVDDRNSPLDIAETVVTDVAPEGSKTLCIYCKNGFSPGPEYINHLIVCPDVKRPDYTLVFLSGYLMDDAYRGYTTVLAQVVDCASMKPFGVSKVLADKYPFSSPYPERRRLGEFNRALQEDRDIPGTMAVHKSKAHVHDPLVANLFAQFYSGKPIEDNVGSQNLVSQLRRSSMSENRRDSNGTSRNDDHFLEGLESDTLVNRTRWFQECLERLLGFTQSDNVQKVVFLYKTESGFSLDDWEKFCVPAIKDFFDKVSRSRVNVVVLNIDQEGGE